MKTTTEAELVYDPGDLSRCIGESWTSVVTNCGVLELLSSAFTTREECLEDLRNVLPSNAVLTPNGENKWAVTYT